jgi:hypothetical protein
LTSKDFGVTFKTCLTVVAVAVAVVDVQCLSRICSIVLNLLLWVWARFIFFADDPVDEFNAAHFKNF